MVPERRCVGCRQPDSKDNLLRVVAEDNHAVSDESATRPGRGAYVHHNPTCVEKSLRTSAWSRALKKPGLRTEGLRHLAHREDEKREQG